MAKYHNKYLDAIFLIIVGLFFGLPLIFAIIIIINNAYIIFGIFLAIVMSIAYGVDKKYSSYSNYSISDKALIINPDTKPIIIKYFDIINIYFDEETNKITVTVSIDYKYNIADFSKSTKEYGIIGDEDKASEDFERLLKLSKLKNNMTKEDNKLRRKKLQELFMSNKLEEF
ncbi:MAG: hypothetical protein PHN56_02570 [Candidatus Nanoarchaeia archaeon]|nr:hypothetical protein [Candidatus Nanoarchaeia archaeon]